MAFALLEGRVRRGNISAQMSGKPLDGIGTVFVIFALPFVSFRSCMILNYTYPPQIPRFGQHAKGFAIAHATGFAF